MDKRILWGCVGALGTLLLFGLAAHLFAARLNQAWMTPLGELPLFDLLGVLTAMAVGAAIARRRFRTIAVALMAVLWLMTLFVLALSPMPGEPVTLPTLLKYNALAIVLTLGLAWLGAWLGERWAGRHPAMAASQG
ncbi:hypothetical protein ACFOLC_15415 [Lysobacter cavernae]|uniref:DUF4175 domain-containing protein n=1 Tax=Lysobacter cavernae TaxID=1685901 RepID=A0ABV7RTA7_9GAMM